jgi:DNA repair protein RadD
MQYRPYQRYAIDQLFAYFQSGKKGNPVVVMPTGTGKSIVLAGFIKEVLSRYPGQRILKLTHVKELIEQNHKTLISVWPAAPAGIYSAGIGRKDVGYPITFAGIASAVRSPAKFGWVDLVLIDECHLVAPKQTTQYQTIVKELRKVNPNLKVIGLTATHYRLGQGLLTEGDNALFTDICVDMSRLHEFNWFIDEGFLVPLVPRSAHYTLDVSDVSIVSGDYNQQDLQRAVDRETVTEAALQEAIALGGGRKHWLVFASGVEHAMHVSDYLSKVGISSTYVHAKLSKTDRDQRLLDYKAGKYQVMVNNGILTTGFDFPSIDLIVMLRPTQSPGLWVQMLGRGTRPDYAKGFDISTTEGRLEAIRQSAKRDCLVLDFAGNTARLGPINDPVVPKSKLRMGCGSAPIRLCPECECYCHASLQRCPHCGFRFPRSVKFDVYAGTNALVAKEEDTLTKEWFPVDRVEYELHSKPGRPDSMRVTYYSGLRRFREWVCFEHEGYPKHKAHDWFKRRADARVESYYPLVYNNTEALMVELHDDIAAGRLPWKEASEILVWVKTGTQYPEILNYRFLEAPNDRPHIDILSPDRRNYPAVARAPR